MSDPVCPRCASAVALHQGRPSVSPEGHVMLWHPGCWELRDEPLPVAQVAAPPAPRARPRRPGSWVRIAGGLAAAVAVAFAGTALAASMWSVDQDDTPPAVLGVREPLAIR